MSERDDLHALYAMGYRPRHRYLWICPRCLYLFRTTRSSPDRHRCEQPKGVDASLCACCIGHVIETSLRWTPVFCDDCRDLIEAFNEAHGATIPTGDDPTPRSPEDAVDHAGLMELVQLRARRRLATIFKATDRTEPERLSTYLLRIHRLGRPGSALTKASGFRHLARTIGAATGADWYRSDPFSGGSFEWDGVERENLTRYNSSPLVDDDLMRKALGELFPAIRRIRTARGCFCEGTDDHTEACEGLREALVRIRRRPGMAHPWPASPWAVAFPLMKGIYEDPGSCPGCDGALLLTTMWAWECIECGLVVPTKHREQA